MGPELIGGTAVRAEVCPTVCPTAARNDIVFSVLAMGSQQIRGIASRAAVVGNRLGRLDRHRRWPSTTARSTSRGNRLQPWFGYNDRRRVVMRSAEDQKAQAARPPPLHYAAQHLISVRHCACRRAKGADKASSHGLALRFSSPRSWVSFRASEKPASVQFVFRKAGPRPETT
jgi:hypothetical protein